MRRDLEVGEKPGTVVDSSKVVAAGEGREERAASQESRVATNASTNFRPLVNRAQQLSEKKDHLCSLDVHVNPRYGIHKLDCKAKRVKVSVRSFPFPLLPIF